MLSLTAHEGRWEDLADQVAINVLAVAAAPPQANTVTLIGENVFVGRIVGHGLYLPVTLKVRGGPH
jgi:hypothetical protein